MTFGGMRCRGVNQTAVVATKAWFPAAASVPSSIVASIGEKFPLNSTIADRFRFR
jgi:hypothetical protein